MKKGKSKEKKKDYKNLAILVLIFISVNLIAVTAETDLTVDLKNWIKVKIVSPVDNEGNVEVVLQDQITRPLDLFFIKLQTAPTTLQENATRNSTSINVTSAVGCSVGDYIGVLDNNFFFGEATAITGTIIDLDSPLNDNFFIGSNIICTSRELNVDGDPTPEIFVIEGIGLREDFKLDITRIMIEMTCTDVPDFTDFCDITNGLDMGIMLRKKDGQNWNIWNIKSNAEMANLMYDMSTLTEAKSFNTNGIIARYTFAGQSKHGVSIRLEKGDSLELWIQDDLSSLLSFRVIAEGHVVQQ